MNYSTKIQPVGMKCYICQKPSERLVLIGGEPYCADCMVRYAPETDVKAELAAK